MFEPLDVLRPAGGGAKLPLGGTVPPKRSESVVMSGRKKTEAVKSTRRPQKRQRAEQARALQTRRQILDAAVDEFGERGFDGANIRHIAQRCGINHQLVIYHFANKDALWQAAALHGFEEALAILAEARDRPDGMTATDTLRHELRQSIEFQLAHPKMQRFILQEMRLGSPRLPWLVENYLRPIREAQTKLFREAQREGGAVDADPDILFYLMVGLTTVIPSLQEEIRLQGVLSPDPEEISKSVWPLLERMVFTTRSDPKGRSSAARRPATATNRTRKRKKLTTRGR